MQATETTKNKASGYVASNLTADEQIVFATRRYFNPILTGFLGLVGLLLIGVAITNWSDMAWMMGFGFFVVLGAVLSWLQSKTNEFVVTTKRVVIKTGILSISTREMNLDKIETVEVSQPFLRLIRSSGTVTIIGSGATNEPFTRILHALEFRRAIQEARDKKAA